MDFKALSNPVTITEDGSSSKPSFFRKLRNPFSKLPPNSKKPVAVALTVFMVFALVLGVYLLRKPTQLAPQASGSGVTIALKPDNVTVATNQEFQVNVFIDTGTTNFKIAAVEAKVNYDPAVLELKSTNLTDYLPVPLVQPQNVSGSSNFTVGSTVQDPKTGSGNIATLTFKALGTSTTPASQITFDSSKTAIAVLGQSTSVATDFTPATVSFGASPSVSPSPGSTNPETSFTLEGPPSPVPPNTQFQVKVYSRSDISSANLWHAVFTYPKDLVEVVSINKTSSFVTTWTEEFFSNTTGEVSLTGGVTNPGLKTNNTNSLMATINFKTKATGGTANLNFTNASAIYGNSDNSQILQVKRNATIFIASEVGSPSPTPSSCQSDSQCPAGYSCKVVNEVCTNSIPPSCTEFRECRPDTKTSPSPSPSPIAQNKGDGNNDGKVDLQDLSIMFSKWSPAINITSHFKLDFDDNLRINSFDYSQMKALLLQLGVIRQ